MIPRVRRGVHGQPRQARLVLFDSKLEANHGDLISWIDGMQPRASEIVHELGQDPLFEGRALAEMCEGVRRTLARSGPARALTLRRARRDGGALQSFLLVAFFRRWLGKPS